MLTPGTPGEVYQTNLLLLSCSLEPSEILFATLSFIFHSFAFSITNLPRKLTVVSLFSTPPYFFSFLFSSHPTSSLMEWKYISTGYTSCSSTLSLVTPRLCSIPFLKFTSTGTSLQFTFDAILFLDSLLFDILD